MTSATFALPIYFDLGATFLYALTGALLAIRRHYDVVGLFVIALVSGIGGGLIRDGIFIQNGPPLAIKDERYLLVILGGCVAAALFGHKIDRLQKVFLVADALGLGAYAVVGVTRAMAVGLSMVAAIMIGVINAAGGGLLRDVLVRDEPLLLKPGQLYVLAALLGASVFAVLLIRFDEPIEKAALIATGCTFVFRLLAILFNLKTVSVGERFIPFARGSLGPAAVGVTVASTTDAPPTGTMTSFPAARENPPPSPPATPGGETPPPTT